MFCLMILQQVQTAPFAEKQLPAASVHWLSTREDIHQGPERRVPTMVKKPSWERVIHPCRERSIRGLTASPTPFSLSRCNPHTSLVKP